MREGDRQGGSEGTVADRKSLAGGRVINDLGLREHKTAKGGEGLELRIHKLWHEGEAL